MKTGILGGTFNPPHIGHLRLAQEASERFNLDKVIFVPCHQPPHKNRTVISPAQHRFNMTILACCDNPIFEVSDMELRFAAPSYTVNTLNYFKSQSDHNIYFIMGSDSLSEIRTWKDYERLFTLANFIIVNRPEMTFHKAWENLPEALKREFSCHDDKFVHTSGTSILRSDIKGLNVSSTELRKLLKRSSSAKYLTPDAVLEYIKLHNLYS